jgi:hypothetical protein
MLPSGIGAVLGDHAERPPVGFVDTRTVRGAKTEFGAEAIAVHSAADRQLTACRNHGAPSRV